MKKSPDAFRTISEVSEWLETPAHVLRFWESRFSQVKPVKRAGGRRYYRPSDMLLLGGIKRLLHEDGMTIRGAQKVLREQGVKHVSTLSQPLFAEDDSDLTTGQVIDAEAVPAEEVAEAPMAVDVPVQEEDPVGVDNVVSLSPAEPDAPVAEPDLEAPETEVASQPPEPEIEAPTPVSETTEIPVEAAPASMTPEEAAEPTAADLPEVAPEPLPTLPLETAARIEPTSEEPPVEESQAELAPTPRQPLGADLPQTDPGDDDDSFCRTRPPLTIQLRDRVVRLKLSEEHRDELAGTMSRLEALQARMSDR